MSAHWIDVAVERIKAERIAHRSYTRAVHDVFSALAVAQPGELVVVVGPSRVGKSRAIAEAVKLAVGECKPDDSVRPYVRINEDGYSRYTPFGILFDKTWVFAQGGRPVIYQPEAEYDLLPEALRWRHMRYEIGGAERVDFTWEREWRLHVDELHFDPSNAVVIVPNAEWEQRLRIAFDDQQDWQVAAYTQILDETIAEAYREDYPWRVACLGKPTPPAQ